MVLFLEFLTVKSDEEALKVASNSKYGLHASVFTQDINRAFHLAKSLPCGTVSVNTFSEEILKLHLEVTNNLVHYLEIKEQRH